MLHLCKRRVLVADIIPLCVVVSVRCCVCSGRYVDDLFQISRELLVATILQTIQTGETLTYPPRPYSC